MRDWKEVVDGRRGFSNAEARVFFLGACGVVADEVGWWWYYRSNTRGGRKEVGRLVYMPCDELKGCF